MLRCGVTRSIGSRGATIGWIVLGAATTAAVAYVFYVQENRSVDAFSAAGSTASFFGVLIALFEIRNLRQVSQATKEAADQTRSRIFYVDTLSEVSSAIKLTDEVMAYTSHSDLDLAWIRLQDLHSVLVRFSKRKSIANRVETTKYTQMCRSLGVDLWNLQQARKSQSKAMDIGQLSKHLIECRARLAELEGDLHYGED